MQAVQILIRDLQRRVGLEIRGSIPDSRSVGAEGVAGPERLAPISTVQTERPALAGEVMTRFLEIIERLLDAGLSINALSIRRFHYPVARLPCPIARPYHAASQCEFQRRCERMAIRTMLQSPC